MMWEMMRFDGYGTFFPRYGNYVHRHDTRCLSCSCLFITSNATYESLGQISNKNWCPFVLHLKVGIKMFSQVKMDVFYTTDKCSDQNCPPTKSWRTFYPKSCGVNRFHNFHLYLHLHISLAVLILDCWFSKNLNYFGHTFNVNTTKNFKMIHSSYVCSKLIYMLKKLKNWQINNIFTSN